MKKIVCVFLLTALLISICTFSVYAETETENDSCKYFDKVVELNNGREPMVYDEVYYHYADENSVEPEWTFIDCVTDTEMWDVRFGVAVEDILIFSTDTGSISDSHYLVYVTAIDEFLRVDSRDIDKILHYCPNFVEIMKEQRLCVLRGDVNDDFEVNIMDTTYIQRFLAGYDDSFWVRNSIHTDNRSFESIRETGYIVTIDNENNRKWNYHSLLDYDCDGETTILDATAIQMKLAKL